MQADLKILTAFRFFAALWVVLFHLGSRIEFGGNYFKSMIENGARGVDFFFILSGFVIFHVYKQSILDGVFAPRRYLIKRINRIYPLHLMMTLTFIILIFLRSITGISHDLDLTVNDVLASTLLLHAWNVTDGLVLNGPSWTISAEFFAYVLFGLAMMGFQNRKIPTKTIIYTLILTFTVAHLCAINLGKTAFMHLTSDYGCFRIIPLFIIGILLRRYASWLNKEVSLAFGVIGILLFLYLSVLPDIDYMLIVPFSLMIISGANLSGQKWVPLNQKIFTYLGEISYSTYMVHGLIIIIYFDLLPKIIPSLPILFPNSVDVLIVLMGVFLGSVFSFHLIERPARIYLNNRFASD
ncbi:MAG: acyltransferase [Alphaproteobacteria bacterium]|nr:acyltransferase [Alphaproteobacteria bacterium]